MRVTRCPEGSRWPVKLTWQHALVSISSSMAKHQWYLADQREDKRHHLLILQAHTKWLFWRWMCIDVPSLVGWLFLVRHEQICLSQMEHRWQTKDWVHCSLLLGTSEFTGITYRSMRDSRQLHHQKSAQHGEGLITASSLQLLALG